MPIDVTTPDSPGWWLQKLAKKRQLRMPRLERLARYHEGDPPLPEGASNMRTAYKEFQKAARTNFAELIVGAVRERIAVRAVRTALAKDADGDETAWQIWRENNLDIEFADVIENMLALGDGYMMVALDPDDDTQVVITGEDPRLVVTIHDPLHQSEVIAGMKVFHDPDAGMDYAYLFLRGERLVDASGAVTWANARRYVAARPNPSTRPRPWRFNPASFDWVEDLGGEDGEELNHRYVPIVRFRNRRGIGEFEPHIDILDRINRTLLQRMVIAMYQAFRMRAIQVDEEDAPDVDENGREVDYDDLLTADPGSFIKVPKDATIWESAQADMTGILSSIKDDVQHLAAVTRTPLSMVSPDAVNQSAEGASLIKEGQSFKTEDKQKRAAASLAVVYMIAFLCLGDKERSVKSAITIDFSPAERFSLAEKYDAYSKATGLPAETKMSEILQFTPEQIALAKGQLVEEALTGDLNGPANAPAPAATAGQ